MIFTIVRRRSLPQVWYVGSGEASCAYYTNLGCCHRRRGCRSQRMHCSPLELSCPVAGSCSRGRLRVYRVQGLFGLSAAQEHLRFGCCRYSVLRSERLRVICSATAISSEPAHQHSPLGHWANLSVENSSVPYYTRCHSGFQSFQHAHFQCSCSRSRNRTYMFHIGSIRLEVVN